MISYNYYIIDQPFKIINSINLMDNWNLSKIIIIHNVYPTNYAEKIIEEGALYR